MRLYGRMRRKNNMGRSSNTWFLDRSAVVRLVDKKTRFVLNEFGRRTMYRARHSQRKKLGPAPPGQPPHAHAGLVKKFTYYKFRPETRSVIIGPELLPGKRQDNLHRLEYGGSLYGHANPRRRRRHYGDAAVIDYARRGEVGQAKGAARVKDWRGKVRYVQFARITSSAMMARAERLEEELWGPYWFGGKRVEARPHARPAGAAETQRLSEIWGQANARF